MADTDDAENQRIAAEQSPNTSDPSKFDAKKPNTLKSLIAPRFGKVKWGLPKLGFPKFKLKIPKLTFKKIQPFWLWVAVAIILISYASMGYLVSIWLNIPWNLELVGLIILATTITVIIDYLLWLLEVILISYACMGYFLSVLITIPARRDLAIAGFIILSLLPTITAFADYALMKWSYLISGFLIIGGLVFFVRLKPDMTILAIIVWVGLTVIAFVGDVLSKSRKLWMAIAILTAPCLIGLGIGHQMWRLAASWS
ncbi:hypothetical protein [Pseudanabaena minima]|uniref:hypothetical protein n=1 Tax=Pseudanabaena minima TaxID=890415 RepID=UPI003DA97194